MMIGESADDLVGEVGHGGRGRRRDQFRRHVVLLVVLRWNGCFVWGVKKGKGEDERMKEREGERERKMLRKMRKNRKKKKKKKKKRSEPKCVTK